MQASTRCKAPGFVQHKPSQNSVWTNVSMQAHCLHYHERSCKHNQLARPRLWHHTLCRVAAPDTACQASETAAAPVPLESDQWLLQPELPSYIGPIELRIMEGKGRGIITTRAVQAGELLLCSAPVAIVNTPTGQPRADGEQLVDHLIDHGLWRTAWFQALYDGTPKSCQACPSIDTPADMPGSAAVETQHSARSSQPAAASGKTQGFAGGSTKPSTKKSKVKRAMDPAKAALEAAGLDRKAAKRIAMTTKLNCYGDNHEDLALCELRHEQPRGHIGIWGPFAMLNHSCAPNAINYVVGNSMLVRAAKQIAAGDEVTISYLGRPQLSPFGARQVKLQEDYGFKCSCERCMVELQQIEKLDETLYEELHLHAGNKLRAQFERAVQDKDQDEVEAIHEQLQASLQQLATAFRQALISPKARLYILSSLYDAFELHLDVCGALGRWEEKAYHLVGILKSVAEVTPGSDLHAILSAQLLALQSQLHGDKSDAAGAAHAAAAVAHTARYGKVSGDMLSQLLHLNRTLYK